MKFGNAVAGTKCPSVPGEVALAVVLYVRLETATVLLTLTSLGTRPDRGRPAESVAWMNRTPLAESLSEPTPNHCRTMSSRAAVAPGSMESVVCFVGTEGLPVPELNVTR